MPRSRALLAVIVGVLSALAWVAPAHAHNSLTASSPTDGATVGTVPEAVTLTFLANLKPTAAAISVTGPDGADAAGAAPSVKGRKVTVQLRPGPAGRYTVTYRVPSGDGHTVKGDIQFSVTRGTAVRTTATPPAASTGTPTAAPQSSVPPAAAPDPAVLASLAASDRMTAEEQGTTWWPWVVGAVLLVAAGAGAYRVRRGAR